MLTCASWRRVQVEFVVNMHDYNKLLRHPNVTLAWGLDAQHVSSIASSIGDGEHAHAHQHTKAGQHAGQHGAQGRDPRGSSSLQHPAATAADAPSSFPAARPRPRAQISASQSAAASATSSRGAVDGAGGRGVGLGGRAGSTREHVAGWEGRGKERYDWGLHYRIYGSHFGNRLLDPHAPVRTAIFSATSCAFSYDISFPTTFYDFQSLDAEVADMAEKARALFPWGTRKEIAWFRGSCWYYKHHGRTAALTMSEVAPELVDAAWYEEVRTEMLGEDGIAHFGEVWEGARHKYLLHLEGHDAWSMRLRKLVSGTHRYCTQPRRQPILDTARSPY